MSRSCGWVELVGVGCRRRTTVSATRLARVRDLVERADGPHWSAQLRQTDGRWHVWIDAVPGSAPTGLLPFFKALGSLVPAACGVLDLDGAQATTRWVMTRGSVDPVHSADQVRSAHGDPVP